MNIKTTTAIALCLTLTLIGCSQNNSPAPVIELGLNIDSPAGAVMVHKGDNLWNISNRYEISMRDIIELNRMSPPYVISVGQRIKLPAPQRYKVQDGDSLYAISRLFGVDLRSLSRTNNLKAPYTISTGEELRIPSSYSYKRQVAKSMHKPVKSSKNTSRKKTKTKSKFLKTPAMSGNGKFSWPVKGPVLSSYGAKKGGLHNDGINIAAPRGAPISSAENGTVVYVGNGLESFGNLVLVRHEQGWVTAYGHLNRANVKKGETVKRGQSIGTIGTTGAVDKPQLHFEIRKGSRALNPVKYL